MMHHDGHHSDFASAIHLLLIPFFFLSFFDLNRLLAHSLQISFVYCCLLKKEESFHLLIRNQQSWGVVYYSYYYYCYLQTVWQKRGHEFSMDNRCMGAMGHGHDITVAWAGDDGVVLAYLLFRLAFISSFLSFRFSLLFGAGRIRDRHRSTNEHFWDMD
ncbi:hypothetical protein B0T19DRAFT_227487 [Cercophora scortea]|uniref:Transmembrane protein n=1 Tax=Cercophora scortea TaxID=314031 RepID=A0AAE0IFQ3_9PEZI|nr:hypothetical protein B0T19DRAFT_227487 [Cercophora scortea]